MILFLQLVIFAIILATCFMKASLIKLYTITVQIGLCLGLGLVFFIFPHNIFSGVTYLIIAIIGIINLVVTRKTIDIKNR